MAQDSVKVSLEVATQAADIALKNLKKTTEETNSSFDIFKGNFAAGLALDAIKGAFSAVSGFISSIVDESSKAQQSIQNMNVALKNAGLYSEATSQHFQALADSIELTTAYEGDAVQASVSLLSSLTKLDKDGISSATKAAVDLAATLNIDLGSATDMIAKAVNGNVTAFGKLGIEIKKGKTDSENLSNTLKALSTQQGAAEKQADTFAGATAKLSNQHGKLLESIGNLITQNPVITSALNGLTEIVIRLSTFIQENQKEISLMAQSLAASVGIVAAAGAAWVTYTAITGGVSIALTTLRTAAALAWTAITGPVGMVIGAVAGIGLAIYGIVKYFDDVKIAVYETTAAYLDFSAKALGIINGDAEKQIKADAQAWRDKADAVRIAQAAEIEAQNVKKMAESDKSSGDDLAAQSLKREQELEQLKEYYAEKTAARNEHNANLLLSETDLNLQLEELKAQHETAMFEISGEYDSQALARQLQGEEARLLAHQQYERDQLNATIEAQKAKALLIQDDQQKEKALRDAGYKAELAQVQLSNKQQIELQRQKNAEQRKLDDKAVKDRDNTLNLFSSLQSSSNKELAAIGKAAALTTLAIKTPEAVGSAYAFGTSAGGPILGGIFAGIASAAMAAQAAQIMGLNFESGGIVPGHSYYGDKVAANVNSREMILNMGQQRRLFDIANGGGDSGGTTNQLLVELISAVKAGSAIHIDGREIVSVVRDGLLAGRTI